MTTEQLIEIEQALERATPGIWRHNDDEWFFATESDGSHHELFSCLESCAPLSVDADLICLLRNQAPALLAYVRKLEEERDSLWKDYFSIMDEKFEMERQLEDAEEKVLELGNTIYFLRGQP